LNTISSKTIRERGQLLVKPNDERDFPFVVVTSIMLGNGSMRKILWMRFLMRGSISSTKAFL
jgi:hypothetical protein